MKANKKSKDLNPKKTKVKVTPYSGGASTFSMRSGGACSGGSTCGT
jgi:hypothetical protein